jgi:hypothetical protein
VEVSARYTYTSMLPSDQLRQHLENKDTLAFDGLIDEWQEIERQVEHLGFGDAYIVSLTNARRGVFAKVTPIEMPGRLAT